MIGRAYIFSALISSPRRHFRDWSNTIKKMALNLDKLL